MRISPRSIGAIFFCLFLGISQLVWSEDLSRDYGKLFTDGPASPRWIALTFDDGPSPNTPNVLAMLKKAGAPATFFMQGSSVEKYPEFAKQVLQAGHMIGNHSYSHPNFYFYKKPDKEQKLTSEIESTQRAIVAATGMKPHFMRMPHGYVRDWVKDIAKREELILVNWTYGSDWTNLTREEMLKGYESRLRPGAILLMHDGDGDRSKMFWVLERVLDEIKKKNLKPVRIDQLLQKRL